MNLTLKEFKAFTPTFGRRSGRGKPVVRGIAVGYCVAEPDHKWTGHHDARELGAGATEHAHSHYSDPEHEGWICVKTIADLGRDGRVSGTLMHELAHLTSGHGHDDAWRRSMARLGQFVGPAWQKRPRPRKSPA